MLVEEGFDVMSVDASDKMLKYALKSRWERRKEPAFDRWGEFFCFPPFCQSPLQSGTDRRSLVPVRRSVIEEANWLTLAEDVQKPGDGFDAVICLGNSFAHLPDFKGGSQEQSHLPCQLVSTCRSFRPQKSCLTRCHDARRGPE